jgi:hypothetical protein
MPENKERVIWLCGPFRIFIESCDGTPGLIVLTNVVMQEDSQQKEGASLC